MVGVVALGTSGVEFLVVLLVVCLLKEDIRADAGVFQAAVVLHRGGGDIHIDAADGSILVMDAVYGLDRLQDVFYRIIARVFAGFERQTLVPHILQGYDLPSDFLLGELAAGYGLVLGVVRTIYAAVHAIVGEIERCEHHDAVAVEALLYFFCQMEDAVYQIGDVALQEHGSLTVGQSAAFRRLLKQILYQLPIVLMLRCVLQRIENLLMVDKLFCLTGGRIKDLVHVIIHLKSPRAVDIRYPILSNSCFSRASPSAASVPIAALLS